MANKAFIVGANTHGLEFAENDAALMRECLEKHDYEVVEAPIGRDGVQAGLNGFFDGCSKNDTVVVYFSGHGQLKSGKLFLLLGEKDRTEPLNSVNLTNDLETCRAKNKLLVLDCCHSGTSVENWEISASRAFPVLVAGERMETTKELDDLKAGFLTWHFHDALMNSPSDLKDDDGKIRLDRMATHLKRMAERHNGQPDADRIPIPFLFQTSKTNFPIADTRLAFTRIREIHDQFAGQFGGVEEMPLYGWPHPIQAALDRLQEHDGISDCVNLFEAFVHFHFVALASQFYWGLWEEERNQPPEEIRPGLAVLRETLMDDQCCGGSAWIERSAILSKAADRMRNRLPFPELVDVFEPGTIELVEIQDGDSPPDNRSDLLGRWRVETGGSVWQFLSEFSRLRKCLNPLSGADILDKATGNALDALQDVVGHLFRPIRTLQLAMISETEGHAGIHCYWDETRFYCVTRRKIKSIIKETWNRPGPPDTDIVTAPEPPRPDWQWDESLLLYDPEQPYDRSVYLMPLGYRYRHSAAPESKKLPGLLDSVRWKETQVASVFQRTYRGVREDGWQTCRADEEGVQAPNLLDAVKRLCHSFAFKMPVAAAPPVRVARQFDLGHDNIAEQNLENMVPRTREMERVLDLLQLAAPRRLLLEGPSGAGKTVLLSQIYIANKSRAVFVTNDVKLTPMEDPHVGEGRWEQGEDRSPFNRDAGGAPAENAPRGSVALRVGMHVLAVINRLMDFPPPNHELPWGKIQDALRDNLMDVKTRRPNAWFLVILDGLNQAADPGGMLLALPDPLPDNLFVLAGSQKQDRVRGPLTLYGRQKWDVADIGELQRAEAEAVVRGVWTRKIEDQKTPKWEDLPETLFQKMWDRSDGLPILLTNWTQRLRRNWNHDPENFRLNAEPEFDRRFADMIPEILESGFETVKAEFDPPELLDALMWCFSLIHRALTVEDLHQAVMALRREGLLPELPAMSRPQVADAIAQSQIGGFLRRMDTGSSSIAEVSLQGL